MKLIYIAGPYRAPTRDGVELNIQTARAYGRLVVEMGHYPVIPHSNTAHFEHITTAGPEFYLDGTLELMRRCDGVLVIPGWQNSEGTIGEIKEAKKLGIPVFHCFEGIYFAS